MRVSIIGLIVIGLSVTIAQDTSTCDSTYQKFCPGEGCVHVLKQCDNNGCFPSEEACPNGVCVPIGSSCKGVCSEQEKKCANGTCISKMARCDGCKIGERRCVNGVCLDINERCDSHCSIFKIECSDGRCADHMSDCRFDPDAPPTHVRIARHQYTYRFGVPLLALMVIFILLYMQYRRRRLMVEQACRDAARNNRDLREELATCNSGRPGPAVGYLPIFSNATAASDPNAPPSYYAASRTPAPAVGVVASPPYTATAGEGESAPPPYPPQLTVVNIPDAEALPPPPKYEDIIKPNQTN